MILYLNTQSYFNLTRRMSQYALWGQVLQHYHYMRLYDPAVSLSLAQCEAIDADTACCSRHTSGSVCTTTTRAICSD